MSTPVTANIFGPEMLWVGLLLLLLFGAKKLPDLARGIGQSLGEFKKARKEFDDNDKPTAAVAAKPSNPNPKKP